jgi:DNA-directed RNA polymerase alpha subunit
MTTLEQLVERSRKELLESNHFDERTLKEAERRLDEQGHYLRNHEATALNRPVSDLRLSVRARKAMIRLSIYELADLVTKSRAALLEVRNFGTRTADEVEARLLQHGHRLQNPVTKVTSDPTPPPTVGTSS